jgi:hypothetical protein
MEAFGIFGFILGLVAFMFAAVAYSQVAGLKAEVAQLRAMMHQGRADAAEPGAADVTLNVKPRLPDDARFFGS